MRELLDVLEIGMMVPCLTGCSVVGNWVTAGMSVRQSL
jgi:hypothetical protein